MDKIPNISFRFNLLILQLILLSGRRSFDKMLFVEKPVTGCWVFVLVQPNMTPNKSASERKKAASEKDETLLSSTLEIDSTKTIESKIAVSPIAGDATDDMTILPQHQCFLVDHYHKMFDRDSSVTPEYKHWAVGLSCLCYLLPAVVIFALTAWSVRGSMFYEACLYIIVATNSFMADHVMIGVVSIWHVADRWTGVLRVYSLNQCDRIS